MTDYPFLGMRGTGDWTDSDMRPKNYRDAILYLYPNGDAPLTALLSKLSEESVDDPEYKWWTQGLPAQSGSITNIYTDSLLAEAYVSGGVAGDTLYVKVAEATAEHFRVGHQALLRYTSDYSLDVNAKVVAVTKNGANSVITVNLLEADDNSNAGYYLADADYILVIGNINPEGSAMPSAIAYDPVKYYNYTQSFRVRC